MIETRIVKIVMIGSLSLFAGLVAFDNLTDYETNYVFVRHVLSMDTTLPGNALMYRSITSPSSWEAAYALIIAGEGATALGFAGGAALRNPQVEAVCFACGARTPADDLVSRVVFSYVLLRHLRSPPASFNRAKGLAAVAAGLGFLVWFFGFMVIGGEWFQMWQSSQWNGQQSAFRFYLTILAVLIFVMQKDE
jgi:predicted small integral membrane protein